MLLLYSNIPFTTLPRNIWFRFYPWREGLVAAPRFAPFILSPSALLQKIRHLRPGCVLLRRGWLERDWIFGLSSRQKWKIHLTSPSRHVYLLTNSSTRKARQASSTNLLPKTHAREVIIPLWTPTRKPRELPQPQQKQSGERWGQSRSDRSDSANVLGSCVSNWRHDWEDMKVHKVMGEETALSINLPHLELNITVWARKDAQTRKIRPPN